MSVASTHEPAGSVCQDVTEFFHVGLNVSDLDRSVRFYTALFGWTVQEMNMGPAGTYRLFMKGDKGIGGAMTAPPGAPSHWLRKKYLLRAGDIDLRHIDVVVKEDIQWPVADPRGRWHDR